MKPPKWSLEDISLPENTGANLREIYNEAFFTDSGEARKVAIKRRGYQDNQEELYMRDEIHPEVRPFTTPILDSESSCSWIAVEKCEKGGTPTPFKSF